MAKGYCVIGLSRGNTFSSDGSFSGPPPAVTDYDAILSLVRLLQPDEIYYLAAHHSSSQQPTANNPRGEYITSHTTHVTGLLNFLEAIRALGAKARLFYAASSLIFAGSENLEQTEETKFEPQGFYGITKCEGLWLCREYRKKYGVYAAVGILYNHESYLRPPAFVSRKIVDAAVLISRGQEDSLELGSIEAIVDWSHAVDFVVAFHAILQLDRADDFIVASGTPHTIREFVEVTFNSLGLDWRDKVRIIPKVVTRNTLPRIGDPGRLRRATGWTQKYDFEGLIQDMLASALGSVNK